VLVAGWLAACIEVPIEAEGDLGIPIPLVGGPPGSGPGSVSVPRLAYSGLGCPGPAGGCAGYCDGPPATCLAQAEACTAIAIDTGAPLTVSAHPSAWSIDRRCMELRAGGDLAGDAAALQGAVARIRLVDPPVIEVPAEDGDWTWGVADGTEQVAAVLGGNTLRDFAIEFRHDASTRSMTLLRTFPGNERALADQGRAYLRLQYPNRIVGRIIDDRCELGGIRCEIDDRLPLDGTPEIALRSARLVLDACVAPPPCEILSRDDDDDPLTAAVCEAVDGPSGDACLAADTPSFGGVPMTLVVATGIPGVVLFDDAVRRDFGDPSQLPACSALTGAADLSIRACATGELATLHVPGWPAIPDTPRIKVRALGLVSGNTTATGSQSCTRLEQRRRGLLAQCTSFAETGRPWRPDSDQLGKGRVSFGTVELGDLGLGPSASDPSVSDAPDIDAWLDTWVVDARSGMAAALRRDIGSLPGQPDGLVGTALLTETEVIVDYTEDRAAPGVRVSCLNPRAGACRAAPTCDGEPDGPGALSCCHGLPETLIAARIREGADRPRPRVADACCAALSPSTLAAIQAELGDLCRGVQPR
jgi:hypothetical protein